MTTTNGLGSKPAAQREELSRSTERIVNDFKTFIGDTEELLQATANLSSEGIATARAQFEQRLGQVKELVSDAEGFTRENYRKAVASTDQYVHEKPWQAVGVALAAGIVVGYLSHRPRSS